MRCFTDQHAHDFLVSEFGSEMQQRLPLHLARVHTSFSLWQVRCVDGGGGDGVIGAIGWALSTGRFDDGRRDDGGDGGILLLHFAFLNSRKLVVELPWTLPMPDECWPAAELSFVIVPIE